LRRELRQQAERISAWFGGMHKDPHGEDAHEEDPRREAWLPPELRGRAADVELLNNSEDPVTDLLVFLSRVSYKVQRWWDQEPDYRVMIGVLPPGRWTISVPKSGGAIVDVKLGGSPAGSRVIAVISFTDSAGNHWARGARSELRQLPTAAVDYWKVHKENIEWRMPTRLDLTKEHLAHLKGQVRDAGSNNESQRPPTFRSMMLRVEPCRRTGRPPGLKADSRATTAKQHPTTMVTGT
jgi:hypothetical protein